MRPRAVVCWRWPRSTMVAAGRMRRGSAPRRSADHSRLGVRFNARRTGAGWSPWEAHRAHPRSSTPVTADIHWRRLLRPARSRRSTASCAAAQGPGAVALGDVRHLARRDHGRRELKALGFAKISARPRHYAQNELAVEAFKKNFPAELAKIRARPKGVEIELWWQDEARGRSVPTRRISSHADGPDVAAPAALATSAPNGPTSADLSLERRRAGHALVRHRRHGRPSRSVPPSNRRPCGADRRSGRLALDAQAGDPPTSPLALPPRSMNPVRMSGNSCATTGCRTGSSNPTKTSSRCAAKPGTTSSATMEVLLRPRHGKSRRSIPWTNLSPPFSSKLPTKSNRRSTIGSLLACWRRHVTQISRR